MIDFKKLSLSDLRESVKLLRQFKDMSRKMGKRGKALFQKNISGADTFTVEYFPEMDRAEVVEESLKAYKKVFGTDLKEENITFISKANLLGGIKIYKNDELLDLSFKRIGDKLKNY